ncbi:MAG: 3-phosphoshikimate 1-carboxyvinyltransferase, partial [Candidatus Bathyarchaeia archaeon]
MRVRISPSQVSGRVSAPPSKSYTHRAVILASLSEGECDIINPLNSRDTLASFNACKALGVEIEAQERLWRVSGTGRIHTPEDVINVENSGTTLRIITAVSALAPGGYTVLTGDGSTRRRPMQPLLDALHGLGVECWSTRVDGTAPIVVRGGGIEGGETWIRGDISSQFISALLISTPKAEE